MKMNKKGFTLIEMLVVIAIIAILVAIVVPTVSNSTMKASAAANAANLRSYKAELAIDYLDDNEINGSTGSITAPELKKCGGLTAAADAQYTVDTEGTITVGSGSFGIDYFAAIAETGKVDDTAKLSTAIAENEESDVTVPTETTETD